MLREAHEFSGQKILIYQTDQFLKFASERFGEELAEGAVEEIRAIDNLREASTNAVELVAQKITTKTASINEGVLIFNLKRPVYNFTGSGHFDPHMDTSPSLHIVMVDWPDEGMPEFKVGAGTGTNYDFNVHVKSIQSGKYLPPGRYEFEYKATSPLLDGEGSEEN